MNAAEFRHPTGASADLIGTGIWTHARGGLPSRILSRDRPFEDPGTGYNRCLSLPVSIPCFWYSALFSTRHAFAIVDPVRGRRLKIPPEESDAVYHCVTRTVNGERLFDDVAKESLRRQIRKVADYTGVQVITYAILSNHFHVLVRVPKHRTVSDAELMRRYQVLYPNPTAYQVARFDVLKQGLETNAPWAAGWRIQQLARMGDLSQFMKLVKQRFTIWFNKKSGRFGTLWAERFKSVLLEPEGPTVEKVAAYIDLNCVRAGLSVDPKDYRFCGYAEAVGGASTAQEGLRTVFGNESWTEIQARYRQILFGVGASSRDSGMIAPEEFRRVIAQGGHLPLAAVLRCRLRYFTDGIVLGTRAFVESQLSHRHNSDSRRWRSTVESPPAVTQWDGLVAGGRCRGGWIAA